MKSTLGLSVLVAAAGVLVAGCATHREEDQQLARNAAPPTKEFCLRDTGSRIKQKEGKCLGPGRVYSRDELDRTGSFTAAEALRKLDPAL